MTNPIRPNRDLQPTDPLVSVYPLPMNEDRARYEARMARRSRLRLPIGHPYRWLPTWVNYPLAKLVGQWI